jgi:hypothetical protein
MKVIQLCIVVFLNSFFVLGQKKDVAIKVYLEDAYTGKNIKDAKVTLEGFEIPEIVGDYDKKGKFYYFTEIPEGYNTIMAYHNKYNEKGFQDLNALPNELKLKLQDFRYVSYVFDEPVIKTISKDYIETNNYLGKINEKLVIEKKITNPNYKYLYQEDPYHIAIFSKYEYKDFISNDSINILLKKLSLEYTYFKHTEKSDFEYLYMFNQSNSFIKYDQSDHSSESIYSKCYVYFFHKKDKTKFKRYNCKEIQELRKSNFQVAVITNRVYEYFANTKFNNNSYDLFYKHHFNIHAYLKYPENYEFGMLKIPEQIFFKNSKQENDMYFGKEKSRNFEGNLQTDKTIETLFFIMPKKGSIALGLGALDIENKVSFSEEIYFFNSLNNIRFNITK